MSPPWMPLYIADYRADTAHLSVAEHGAYLLLIMHYWQTGGLPDDDRQLSRIACMTAAQWRAARPVVQAFFHEGWKHKRIDAELSHAADVIAKRRSAVAQREIKRKSNDGSNDRSNDASHDDIRARASPSPPPEGKIPEPDGSAPDPRADLFGRGLKSLAQMTGKTPDSCRSLVGKWLKSVNDEAVHVLGRIDDAERNRVVDPVAWITGALKPHDGNNHGKRTVHDAANDLLNRLRSLDEPAPGDLRHGASENPVRLLPPGRRE